MLGNLKMRTKLFKKLAIEIQLVSIKSSGKYGVIGEKLYLF